MARTFYVTNCGKRITDAQAAYIIECATDELKENFCPAWQIEVPTLIWTPDGSKVPKGVLQQDIIDYADKPPVGEDGVLGVHSEDAAGNYVGDVYAGYELDNGGQVLALQGHEPSGATTVASIFFHELVEQLRNPTGNEWWDGPIVLHDVSYASVAAETGDPVEAGFVKRKASDGTEVWLSDYILPNWRDPEAKSEFNRNGDLTAPFTVAPMSYAIVRNDQTSEQSIFADGYPEHRKLLKAWKRKVKLAAGSVYEHGLRHWV